MTEEPQEMRCKWCGQPIRYVDATWERHDAQRAYFGDVGAPDVPFSEYERVSPARSPAVGADVIVPALAAAISGVTVVLLGASVLVVTGGDARWAFVAGAAATAVIWFTLLSDSRQLLRTIERVVGVDVDGDGYVGDPEPAEPQTFRVEYRERRENSARTSYIDLPEGVTHETMREVARAVLGPSGAFSRPFLCNERGLLSQNAYNELRRRWLDAGLVIELPGNRTELTAAGRAILRAYLKEE